jgi:hypothetical protein
MLAGGLWRNQVVRSSHPRAFFLSADARRDSGLENPGWENTVLGSVEINGTRLFVDVNSEKRERVLRDIITKALGNRACYRATEIQSLETLLAEHHVQSSAAQQDAGLAELPEVQAKMREIMARTTNSG